jgi:hypothetical protein
MYCELAQPVSEMRVIPKILLRCGRLKACLKHRDLHNACNSILVNLIVFACGLLAPGQHF